MMTAFSTNTPQFLRRLAPLVVFVALLIVLTASNGGAEAPAAPEAATAPLPEGATEGETGAAIDELRSALESEPVTADRLAALGDAYYQRGREASDGAYATLAGLSYESALELDRDHLGALTGRATLALIAHDFPTGLRLAERVHELEPDLAAPYLPLIDGLIETGRYGRAAREIEELQSLKPGLPAYSRASYWQELHGDIPGALRSMRIAADVAPAGTESKASVEKLVGDLERELGRYDAAKRSYERALASFPGYVPARAGLLDLAAARGDVERAIAGYRRLVDDGERTEYADELGRLEESDGRRSAARGHYEILSELHQTELESGQQADAGQVLFEADHGSSELGVELGRRVWRSAPSVSSADALAWALYADGDVERASELSRKALRIGTDKPLFLYHAGMIAAADGRDAAARRQLGKLLERSPRFDPLFAPRAERALAELG